MSDQIMIRTDLHVHTSYSPDASISPKTIVDQLYAHPFIKAVAITDHNTVEGYFKARELASVYGDVLIIPGVEVSTLNGDIIVLGIAELPPKPWTIKNVIDFAKEKGALTIAAHPYRAYGLGDLARKCDVDAIEILNGASPPDVNRSAENLAKEMKLPGVAGSDAHQVGELWTVYTEVQAASDVYEILKAIKHGLVKVGKTEKSIHF
jgi:predicted metal-dependent phosphoesterase TrpH